MWPLVAPLLISAASACSPELNWRAVRLEGLQAMLPCKPDHGERSVQLGQQEVLLKMSGCEAAGALYAISHIRVQDANQADATQAAWRTAALANMQASAVQSQPIGAGKIAAVAPEMLSAQGKLPDGKVVEARLVWIAAGTDIYHVAVYGPRLDNARLEMLYADLHLQ